MTLNIQKYPPLMFVVAFLIFTYFFQYLLSGLFALHSINSHYIWTEWLSGYAFVLWSSAVMVICLYAGMSGKPIRVPREDDRMRELSRLDLIAVFLVFALFFLWSFMMLRLKIGITIYRGFEPLPFKLAGLLHYGRLFVQPMILAYVAYRYRSSNWKIVLLIFILIFSLGSWVSISSGSRYLGIMFAVPFLYLFSGSKKYLYFCVIAAFYVVATTLSRYFFLSGVIGGEILEIYGNPEVQSVVVDNMFIWPIKYIVIRTMGMTEVLMTLNFGNITSSVADSVQNLIAYFVWFVPKGAGVSIKNIYGLEDSAFGGYGLDLFSNYWVFFGGTFVTYTLGLAWSCWLLGRTYRLFSIGFRRVGFQAGAWLLFFQLFILLFQGQAHMFLPIFAAGWLFSRESTHRIASSVVGILRSSAL